MSNPMRIIIAGSRTLEDYALVQRAMKEFLEELNYPRDIVIYSGGAKGADALGELWAWNRNLPVEVSPADWDRFGKGAGLIRNEAMAKQGDACLVLWDGKSKGAYHMAQRAAHHKLKLKIVCFEA